MVLPAFTNVQLMGGVMKARKKLKIPYPNLYAVPGHHDKADEFNRVQRGHQNYLEMLDDFRLMALIGGLKNPYLNAFGGVCFSLGSYLYQVGYSDMSLDVKFARHKKGAMIKWVGYLIALGTSISFSGSLLNFW